MFFCVSVSVTPLEPSDGFALLSLRRARVHADMAVEDEMKHGALTLMKLASIDMADSIWMFWHYPSMRVHIVPRCDKF